MHTSTNGCPNRELVSPNRGVVEKENIVEKNNFVKRLVPMAHKEIRFDGMCCKKLYVCIACAQSKMVIAPRKRRYNVRSPCGPLCSKKSNR